MTEAIASTDLKGLELVRRSIALPFFEHELPATVSVCPRRLESIFGG